MVSVAAWDAPRPQCPLRVRALIAILIIFLPGLTSILYAQTTGARMQATARPAANSGAAPEGSEVSLTVGRSTVLDVPSAITRVSLTSPDIADVVVTTPQQVLIHGKAAGTISMFVWERAGGIRRYEVTVRRDLTELEAQLRELFPGEPISATSNGKNVVLSGKVSTKYAVDKAVDVATGYVEKKENVVNLLQQAQGLSNQVLLRVRFAEVSRTALSELGASFFTDVIGQKNWIGRSSTEQFAAPDLDDGRLVFSDYLNLFLFNTKYHVGAVIKALSTRGLFQSLAEPNLIAQNGTEASFLAGGEYPYPVVQGSGQGLAVTIVFKEFGIRLNFTPTVLEGDLIHLKVRPEVSSLDFTNAISIQGFRVPALNTRRAETEVELRSGQTFAIAGLLNNTLTSTMEKIPGIGDIPILGYLFKSRAARKERTELVVMITPEILPPTSPGAAPGLPGLIEPYLPPVRTVPAPPPYGGPVTPRGSVVPAPGNNQRPVVQPAASSKPGAPAEGVMMPSPSATTAAPAPEPKLTKEQREAMERARLQEQKRLEAQAALRTAEQKRAAEQAKLDAVRNAEAQKRQAAETKKRQEVERQQAKEKAEVDRRAAEARKRQEEAERKRGKALAEAEARLKAAQAAYQEQLKGSSTQNQP